MATDKELVEKIIFYLQEIYSELEYDFKYLDSKSKLQINPQNKNSILIYLGLLSNTSLKLSLTPIFNNALETFTTNIKSKRVKDEQFVFRYFSELILVPTINILNKYFKNKKENTTKLLELVGKSTIRNIKTSQFTK